MAWPSPAWLLSQASFPPVPGSDYKCACRGGGSEKRGVHFPHTLFFHFPVSPPLNYINEYFASLHSLHTCMVLLAWPLLGTQGTEYKSICHPQGWGRLPQAPALTSQHIPCAYEPILGLREVKAVQCHTVLHKLMRLHMAPASLCWAGHLVSKSVGWAQRLVIATPNAKTASCLWMKKTFYLGSSAHIHTLTHTPHN